MVGHPEQRPHDLSVQPQSGGLVDRVLGREEITQPTLGRHSERWGRRGVDVRSKIPVVALLDRKTRGELREGRLEAAGQPTQHSVNGDSNVGRVVERGERNEDSVLRDSFGAGSETLAKSAGRLKG